METLTILLPTDLIERLTAEAEERGLPVGEYVGLVVAGYLRTRHDGLDVVDQFRDQ